MKNTVRTLNSLFYITGLEDSGYLFHRVLPILSEHFEIAEGKFPPRFESFDQLVEVLREQVSFREPFFLLGESFGSAVAFHFASKYPDELAGVIVSGGMVRTPGFGTWLPYGMRLVASIPDGLAQYLVRPIAEWQANRRMVREYRSTLIDRLSRRSSVAMLKDAIRLVSRYDITDRLHQFQTPTLALWGEDDQLVRRNIQQPLMERIPGIRQVVFSNTTHICLLERPAESSRAILEFAEEVRVRDRPSVVSHP